MLLTLHRRALFYLGCSAHSLSASCLPGSLDMSQQLPPALPPMGLFRVPAPNTLRYLQERVKLFNVIERCARKAEDLTNQRDYAQGWLAITGHVILTRFTDLASLGWARPHFEHLLEDLNHHSGTYAVKDCPDAHYPVSTSRRDVVSFKLSAGLTNLPTARRSGESVQYCQRFCGSHFSSHVKALSDHGQTCEGRAVI